LKKWEYLPPHPRKKKKKNTVWNMMYHILFGRVHLYSALNKRRGGTNFGGWVNTCCVPKKNNRGKGKENKGWSSSCSKSPLQPFPPIRDFVSQWSKGPWQQPLGTPLVLNCAKV
jgi:hypothetical protein